MITSKLVKLISFGLLLPIVGSVLSISLLHNIYYVDEGNHIIVELLGANIAIFIAPLLLLQRKSFVILHENQVIWIVMAISCMGLLDAFHALAAVGKNFVWLHSLATFVGGMFFSMVLWPNSKTTLPIILPVAIFIAMIVIVFISFNYEPVIPAMVIDGNFTLTARILNIAGGVGFVISCCYLFYLYSSCQDIRLYYLASHCLLFGVAGILFEVSTLWDMAWWWWHILRLIAYVILILFFMSDIGKYYQEQK